MRPITQTIFALVTKIRVSRLVLVLACVLSLSSCHPIPSNDRLTVLIGSWYGFYPFYYAVNKGIDKKYGLELKIIEATDINNFRRNYLHPHVSIIASSMLEFTNANTLLNQEIPLCLSPIIRMAVTSL